MEKKELTRKEALHAMGSFLEGYNKYLKSEDIYVLLGFISVLKDGKPLGDSAWIEWNAAVDNVLLNGFVNYMELTQESGNKE